MSRDRLRHSPAGLLRSLQISRASLVICIEGSDERYFFESIVQTAVGGTGTAYQVVTAQELSGSGGKRSLLEYFEYLRMCRRLSSATFGKRLEWLFFLDKDVDDIRGTRVRSLHIKYSSFYEWENYVYRFGDLAKAVAVAGSAGNEQANAIIGGTRDWCLQAARAWQEWTVLCVSSALGGIGCKYTYGTQVSAINADGFGELNVEAQEVAISSLRDVYERKGADLGPIYERAAAIVGRFYSRGRQDCVFKGKWYLGFLVSSVVKSGLTVSNGLRDRLYGAVVMTLDFQGGWAEEFRRPIRRRLLKINA